MTDTLFEQYREYIYSRYGIHYPAAKSYILKMKLGKILDAVGDPDEFYMKLASGDINIETCLLKEITVGHTFFFREMEHLDLVVSDIRSRLVRKPLIWSAASATGEEPYSIAIYLLENGVIDFTIVSSDVNRDSLRIMNRGIFHESRLEQVPRDLIRRYFRKVGSMHYEVHPGLRSYIKIKKLNLHEAVQFENLFDYIFCRNVMIYFDEAGRQTVLRNLLRNLKPSGLFFVGYVETIMVTPSELDKVQQAVYRLTGCHKTGL